jgi:DNA mismatch repair protein MutL
LTIRVLTPEVAARIAAGEVVERPASVVKELIENSLDAGATSIAVEVSGGGLDSIRLTDDGCGLAADELALAFERHATSKLEDDELLRIRTLGFRGEALPSIASVSDVEMVSRPEGSDAAAAVRLVEGAVVERGERGAPVGTSVTVRRLFARQPARRKFLRSPATESSRIASVVSHYALAYPAVRFSLALEGRQALLTDGNGELRDAVAAVYGADIASAMLPLVPAEGAVEVSGLAAAPQVSRGTRGHVSLFVNGRWVQSRRLAYAVEEAYRGLLMVGRYPIAVLKVTLPFEDVDVNVHPTKAEVRFRDESAAFGAVQRVVRAALLESAPIASGVVSAAPPATAQSRPALDLAPPPVTAPLWEHARALERRRTAVEEPQAAAAPTAPATPAEALPALRVIGQMGGVYVIAEGPDGMYLIDQHAAHERVLYERFRRQRAERAPEAQSLLEPLALEATPSQRALLGDNEALLGEHGFALEPFGEGSYLVRALPAALAGPDPRQALAGFLDILLEEGEGDGRDRVAMSLACHVAIRAGKTLAREEMRELVSQLEASDTPHTCPHGRPTMIHMSAEMLARQFGRR